MTQLQLVIRLSMNCVESFDRGDYDEARRLMRVRDQEYRSLTGIDAMLFSDWAAERLTDDEQARIMAMGEPS